MRFKLVEDATSFLGKNNIVPTKEDIVQGKASYGGIPIVYSPTLKADAENYTTKIYVSPKFFSHPYGVQQHILNHEVAHNLSDQLIKQHSDDWKEFCSRFIQEKPVPISSSAHKNGQRTYWEGLYGDIGATALSETLTRAITEYLDDPERLMDRSEQAYQEIDTFMKKQGN